MKLLAPVSSYDSAVKQIEAGADEIYLGADDGVFESFCFTGRGKYNPNKQKINPGKEELEKIVQYAHDHGVSVMYTANLPFLSDAANKNADYEKCYLDYVEMGIKAGVDSIIVGDIGALLLIRKEGITTHLTSSSFLESVNKDQVLFFKEIGVNRVVLSYQIAMEEILELANSCRDIEFEVFGHYGCSFYDGYCNFKHFFGETRDACIRVPCQNPYVLSQNGSEIADGQVLSSLLACSICSLPTLIRSGICSLKLVGRSLDIRQNVDITRIYATMIKELTSQLHSGQEVDKNHLNELRNRLLPPWWKQILCKQGTCKYKMNKVTKSFVGLNSQ